MTLVSLRAVEVGYHLAFTRNLPTGAAIVGTTGLFLLPGIAERFLRGVSWR